MHARPLTPIAPRAAPRVPLSARLVFGLAMVHFASAHADDGRAPEHLRDGPAGYTFACAVRTPVGVPGVRLCAELGAAQRCEHESDFASHPTSQATGLTIVNRSSEAIKLYWLDPQGARALYSTIPPGGKVSQESHIGASWVITSRDGHCIGVFNAAPVSIAIF